MVIRESCKYTISNYGELLFCPLVMRLTKKIVVGLVQKNGADLQGPL